jgi:hypothetical protein
VQEEQDQHGCTHDPKLIEFDAPAAGTVSSPVCAPFCGTTAYANDNLGEIVGYYTDTNIVPHGFLRTRDSHLTTFDVPSAATGPGQGSAGMSINLLGTVAGVFADANNVMHGFSRSPRGTFATFDAPDAGTVATQPFQEGTRPSTNNLQGTVAGWYIDADGLNHGFVWNP